MTREEAKDILREKIFPCIVGDWKEAIGIAINALSAEKRTGKRTETHACDCISRKQAIDAMGKMQECMYIWAANSPEEEEAIEALVQNVMGQCFDDAVKRIEQLPSAQPEIIRCKDCKFYREYGCQRAFVYPEPEDFCSMAERRTDE